MTIYTRGGTRVTILRVFYEERQPYPPPFCRVPVEVLCHDDDGVDRPFYTYIHDLRADGGIATIHAEIDRVRRGL